MKKIYALIVVITCFYGTGSAQDTYTWVGNGGDNNWSTDANWSGPGAEPADGDIVLFQGSQAINVSLDVDIILNSLRVEGSAGLDVNIIGNDPERAIFLTNTTSALNIGANTILRINALSLVFETNAKGAINGTLSLEGTDASDCAVLDLMADANELNINNGGSLISKVSTNSFLLDDDNRLRFNEGSKLLLQEQDAAVPWGYFHPTSEIVVSGLVNQSLSFEELGAADIGKLTYNCPNQATDDISLNLRGGVQVRGDLNIVNTNNHTLTLMANSGGTTTDRIVTIAGNLVISGTSKVALSYANAIANKTYTTIVNGSVMAGGTSFSLQDGSLTVFNPQTNLTDIIDPTTLIIKGNLQHTAGIFNVNSVTTSEDEHLFTIEMNGNGSQTISSVTGTFASNGSQLTLRLNNTSAAGITLLSNLSVGRVKFVDGILNTNANHIAVTNSSNNSLVLDGPSSASYIAGNLRRTFNTTAEILFPLGFAGDNYRPIRVVPSDNTTSVYEASFTNSVYSDVSTQAPLQGIAPYYWNVSKISGANAKLRLTLPGQIANVLSNDSLMASKYDGADWITVHEPGSILAGNASSGTIETQVLSTFSPFTFGYAMNVALPIHLVSFTAKKSNSSAQLNWKITDNSTPQTFEILKSVDGARFSSIGKVSGSEGKLSYDYTDNSLLAGNNYYRLKMIDKDGSVTYSQIVMVMNGTRGVVISSMIPTMVVDRARLNISSSEKGNMQLVVTDMNGRIVHTQNAAINIGNQEVWLNASKISSGIFQITGYINGEKTATLRFFHR